MRLRRYALLAAIGVLAVIGVGAYVTSRATAPQLASHPAADAATHRIIATAVGLFCLWLAYWQSARMERTPLPVLSALALFVVTGCIGWMGGQVVLHATVAPLAFASFVAVAVTAAPDGDKAPPWVDSQAARRLRPLVFAAPPLLILQTALGAAYRHKVIGILAHVGFALVVTIAVLAAAVITLQQAPRRGALRSAALWVIAALAAQVALGFTALTIEVLERGDSLALARVISTALHVVVGSLTLAASLVLAIQVQRRQIQSLATAAGVGFSESNLSTSSRKMFS